MSQVEVLDIIRRGKREYAYTCGYIARVMKKSPATVSTNILRLFEQGVLEKVYVIHHNDKIRMMVGYRIKKGSRYDRRQDKRRKR